MEKEESQKSNSDNLEENKDIEEQDLEEIQKKPKVSLDIENIY